jgi:ectoine hydroxylase-related dioxygenase (phytanoyl-CoA dioxygenase family)
MLNEEDLYRKQAELYASDLKKNGYTVIKKAIRLDTVEELLKFATTFEYSTEENEILFKNQQRLNGFAQTIYNIALKRPDFLRLFIRGMQGEVLKILLNDDYYKTIPQHLPNFILRSMLLRSSLSAMPYHIDSFIPYIGEYTSVLQIVIFLNDSKIDNGCTLVVPNSHQSGIYAPQENQTREIPLEANAGDIVIWDSRTWHATTENFSKKDRWALIATFTRWFIKQGFDYPRAIQNHVFSTLDDDEKIVYGFCSTVPMDEFEKTELKTGLDGIKFP